MSKFALRVRPESLLRNEADWMLKLDPDSKGIYVPLTGAVEVSVAEDAVKQALRNITDQLRAAADTASAPWTLHTDGGERAVSMPQQGVQKHTRDSWFLNLCCMQSTLGQLAAQLHLQAALEPFRAALFPRVQRRAYTASTDNLGAWQIELKPADPLTRTEALAWRSQILVEAESWALTLEKDNEVLWPTVADLDKGVGVLYRPILELLPASLYPPMGEACDEEKAPSCALRRDNSSCFRRTIRPFQK